MLVKALDYPDRRVQLAAADALLRLPSTNVHTAHARIVEVLRRALAADAETTLPQNEPHPGRRLSAGPGRADGRRGALGRLRSRSRRTPAAN